MLFAILAFPILLLEVLYAGWEMKTVKCLCLHGEALEVLEEAHWVCDTSERFMMTEMWFQVLTSLLRRLILSFVNIIGPYICWAILQSDT
eukprot:m.304975 g.304975  ORF g.304975 m.304975 type:complete len:90 (-) comp16443_c7_seq6:38-307(-)